MTPQAIIYTDGGYRPKFGVGAWGYLIINTANNKAIGRSEAILKTTNNRMEMSAVVEALSSFQKPMRVHLISDSQYTIKSCSIWMKKWKAEGWAKKDGELKNVDILKKLDQLLSIHKVTFEWVKGHSGNKGNDYVDTILNRAMNNLLNNGTGSIREKIEEWKS